MAADEFDTDTDRFGGHSHGLGQGEICGGLGGQFGVHKSWECYKKITGTHSHERKIADSVGRMFPI